MKIDIAPLETEQRTNTVKAAINAGSRLGLITSVDGSQLLTLLLTPEKHEIQCFETELESKEFHSITPMIPQAHWFERMTWDMFGILPLGHPRLKHTHLHEPYSFSVPPLRTLSQERDSEHDYEFLGVEGEGVYEIPVGPIHAGIIEPGHFRFSCYGEVIINLEIRLGYVHRGVEKTLTEIPWTKARFVAEAAASDMAVANACAHATAIESLQEIEVSTRASLLRTAAMEIERVAMHISDLGGLASDVGFLAVSSSMARLRGMALRLGELISGSRFMRGYISPGGVSKPLPDNSLNEASKTLHELNQKLTPVIEFFLDNQLAVDRMEGVGKVSPKLAHDFGLVGVSGRASGSDYDCRKYWSHGIFPKHDLSAITETGGDVLARAKVRIGELNSSLKLLAETFDEVRSTGGRDSTNVSQNLPTASAAVGIVESHRGELIHLILTDENGLIRRYCIKGPSLNNWTGLSIAVRNNLIADFPLCNKSFSLSYSGHDL